MRLHEALETGLEHKRTGEKEWLTPVVSRMYYHDEILATDWVVREPAVTLTRKDFWDAVAHLVNARDEGIFPSFHDLYNELFRKEKK